MMSHQYQNSGIKLVIHNMGVHELKKSTVLFRHLQNAAVVINGNRGLLGHDKAVF